MWIAAFREILSLRHSRVKKKKKCAPPRCQYHLPNVQDSPPHHRSHNERAQKENNRLRSQKVFVAKGRGARQFALASVDALSCFCYYFLILYSNHFLDSGKMKPLGRFKSHFVMGSAAPSIPSPLAASSQTQKGARSVWESKYSGWG